MTSAWVFALVAGCSNEIQLTNHLGRAPTPKLSFDLDFENMVSDRSSSTESVHFIDVAPSVGLEFSYHTDAESGNLYLPETLGGGAAAFDFDLDGWCDLYLANGRSLPATAKQTEHNDALFRNVGGIFQAVTDKAAIAEFDYSHGVAVGDFNGDGFEDLLVANWGRCRLFVNQGDGTFRELLVPELADKQSFWVAPLFVDLDNDGFEDLVIASYVEWDYDSDREHYEHGVGYASPGQFSGGPMLVLQNQADGGWLDRTSDWGFTASVKCLGIAAVDLDHDLKPEVYLANDGTANLCFSGSDDLDFNVRVTNASRHSSAAEIRSNAGQVFWQDVAEWSGTAGAADGLNEASMCVTLADFTRNGWTDIFVTNYYMKKNTLYANKGNLSFRDISWAMRLDVVGYPYVSFGAVPVDYNFDGVWDVFVANGHVIGPNAPINEMPSQLLKNVDGVFFDISDNAGPYFQQKSLARCVVTIDSLNRGIPDLVVTHTDRPVSLVQDQSSAAHEWICFEVFDPRHRPVTGGRIELTFSTHLLTIPMIAGGSYIGESQKRWTLGLGSDGEIPAVQIYWPDGTIDTYSESNNEALSPGRIWRLAPGTRWAGKQCDIR